LAALKSLLELNKAHDQGPSLFEVELLESRNSIGGVWTFNDSASEITALRNTVQNTSRFRNCYTDFPVKEAWRIGGRDGHPPPYLTQEDSAFYLNQYAKYHNLKKHIRFGCRALALKRDEVTEQWQVETLQHSSNDRKWRGYDKIIVATGQHHDPMIPHVEGIENFNGQVLHSAEFKRLVDRSFSNQINNSLAMHDSLERVFYSSDPRILPVMLQRNWQKWPKV
jgi:dimethylaniline monooxygenase (N-oxide forming)